jgi:APA family basic amino acid/polyamine antiporter
VSFGSITINWGAKLLIVALTLVLCVGVKVCSRISIVLTTFKILVLLLAVTAGIGFLNPKNYVTYVREGKSSQSDGRSVLLAVLSWFDIHPSGAADIVFSVFAAASLLVFAFIGFDVVATASEETRDPDRSLPKGISGSLVIAIILYLFVAVVLIGVVDYNELERAISAGERVTLATVFESAGVTWVARLIDVGALAGLITVVMLLMLGQARVLFAISRDGLLPRRLGRVGIRGIPQNATLVVGVVVFLFSVLGDVMPLGELVSFGALSVYAAVAWTAHWLLWNNPEFLDHFQTPDPDHRQDGHGLNRRLSVRHFVPLLGTLLCFFLMLNLKGETWLLFLAWLAIGIAVYCCYGRKNSGLAQKKQA